MYTKEQDEDISNRWWIVSPDGDYVVDVATEDIADILLSHLSTRGKPMFAAQIAEEEGL